MLNEMLIFEIKIIHVLPFILAFSHWFNDINQKIFSY